MAEEGFKVATAYVALTVSDGDVQAQIEQAVTQACEQAGQEGGSVLTEEIAARVDAQAPAISEPLIESVAEAGQVSAEEWAAAMAMFDDSTRSSGAVLVETMADSGRAAGEAAVEGLSVAEQELAAWRESVAEASAMGANISPAVTEALAQVEAGALSASDAVKLLEASQNAAGASATLSERAFMDVAAALRAVGTSSGLTLEQMRELAVGFDTAQTAVEQYGTSEAQLAICTQVLERAEASLAEQNATLMQTYLLLGAGAPAELQALQDALDGVADAQNAVTAAASAQVDAMNAVNLAVIQNTSATLDDENALRALLSVADATGFELADLAAQLEEGSYATLNMAAADAEAQLRALALADAEQQLAAANITLVDTYQQLAMGAEVSAEAQTAALDAVAAAQRQVQSLGGSATPLGATAGELGSLGAMAKSAGGEVAGLGGAMGGPLMGAVWMAMGVLPMLTYMFQGNSQAAQAAAQAHQQLAQAISKDGDAYGANTVALITNDIATSGAADTLKTYGVSLTEASEYLANVQGAQDSVTSSLDSQVAALEKARDAAVAQGQDTSVVDGYTKQIEAIQATQDTLDLWRKSIVDTITQQNDLSDATLRTEQAIGVFTLQVHAAVLAQQQQAQTALVNATAQQQALQALVPGTQAYANAVFEQQVALEQNARTAQINATALNQSLVPQAQLAQGAVNAAVAYQQASTNTSAFTNALTALYGQYGDTSQAQASFTTALDGLTGKIKAGKDAVDLNTQAGAANFTQFQQVAQAAETYSEKLYEQTGNAAQANTALQTMATKLDAAASKAGLTKTQVHELNVELFGVPDVKDIKIEADTSAAWDQVKILMAGIDEQIGHVTIVENTVGGGIGGNGLKANATGGPVTAGVPVITGDGGRTEVFVPNSDGRIYPTVDEGARAMAQQGWGGATIHQYFYGTQWPSVEQTASMNRELASAIGAV